MTVLAAIAAARDAQDRHDRRPYTQLSILSLPPEERPGAELPERRPADTTNAPVPRDHEATVPRSDNGPGIPSHGPTGAPYLRNTKEETRCSSSST